MNRPVSPLLHDYKNSTGHPVKQANAVRWFAVGLGLPLVIVALVISLADSSDDTSITGADEFAALIQLKPEIKLASFEIADTANTSIVKVPRPEPIAATPVAEPNPEPNVELTPAFHPPMLAPQPTYDSIKLTIRRGDTLDQLFRKHGLSIGDLAMMSRMPETGPHLRVLKPGDELEIVHDNGKLISVYRELNLTSALKVTRGTEGFAAETVERAIEIRKRRAYGRIDSSLFESGSAAGLPDKLVMNLAGIFAWDIDFVLDIRQGDDYYILYEEIYQDGQYVMDGAIIAAEFNNDGRTIRAIRFVNEDGRVDYFTPEGESVRKAFVRAPVDFTRISSSFNPRRRHPVLNTIRAHRGVDYAAPKGTPIKAAGDGKVIFRGRKGGYGNAVIVQHGGNITTLYAHMSNFARSAPFGSRVKQSQVIGFVGSTGLATAAHLHYEYRLNGVHRNPRTVKLPQAEPIGEKYRKAFLTQVEPILAELLQYKRTQIASLTSN